MSREYPDWVNPWKAAEGNRVYGGSIALDRMTRLKPMLAEASGEAHFEADFSKDALGWTVVTIHVTATLQLICQASLEVYAEAVDRTSDLAVIEDLDDQVDIPEHYDPTKTEGRRLNFLELVQDELILAVPQVPRKPGQGNIYFSSGPQTEQETGSGNRKSPFAALGDLVRDGSKQTDKEQD